MAATIVNDDAVRPLALVTGGHHRLGGVIAAAFAAAGYDVAIHGSHDAGPDTALAAALCAMPGRWHGFVADFNDHDAPAALMGAVAAHFGRAPDVLVNSASLFGQDGLASVTGDDLLSHYRVGCAAHVLLTRAFVAAGPEKSGRVIVNMLDQRLEQPHGDQLSYSLAKHALAGFTQIAARTLAPHVRVNAVAPGLTLATDDYDAAQIDRVVALMPLKALPGAADVADAVIWLAQAKSVTGQVITVDGGAHMRSFDHDFMHL